MTDDVRKKSDSTETQVLRLQKEINRLQRMVKRQETQLQQLDKMASANEKININLYKELESLSRELEANNRELEIEAALERVRARAMAMQKSDDLEDAIAVVFKELDKLGIATIRCGVTIIDANDRTMDTWIATMTEEGQEVQVAGLLPVDGNPTLEKVFDVWQKGEPFMSYELEGEALKRYYKSIASDLPLPEREVYRKKQVVSLFFFREGGLYTYTAESLSDEAIRIFQRFAKVFAMTYRRFLDLKQAEEQAREARIEAALERIRTRTLLMKDSTELNEAVAVFFQQFKSLDLLPAEARTYFCHIDTNTHTAEVWMTHTEGTVMKGSHFTPLNQSPSLKKYYEAWKRKEPINVRDYSGEALQEYLQFVSTLPHVKTDKDYRRLFKSPPQRIVMTDANFLQGNIGIMTFEPLSLEALETMVRFAKVFEFTYTRFLDLKKAEEQAREAEQQASLDRVRAEIASMRTAHDLQRITPLIWRELNTLGVPFFRCGVFIVDEAAELVHSYLSTPSGESLAALHLKFDSMPLVKLTVKHWRQQKVYRGAWDHQQFTEWTQLLIEQGLIVNRKKYQGGEKAPEKLVLQFIPFKQGMLYVGSAVPLSDKEMEVTRSLADAFAVAFARYEDFQRLEVAKAEVEDALDNLKRTQSQLVHAEKMASLGQLTAGIAHEIKNPLNFVNNFAELSGELVEELWEEIKKQKIKIENREDIVDILNDLQQNAQKIKEHGKRADSIVKGMLQHSRGSKGERQLTDINAMLEENLNLAYHGMRAQDSSFNIIMEKQLDTNLAKIDVVPQDISRVFLNIITNGFYAVHQRHKKEGNGFSPSLSVQTRLDGNRVEIRIRDNGSGIPADIRQNIFQPFFTTKPAGQGTGLGLSISYDIIVQEYDGEIRVDSQEDEFTEFIIVLPVNTNDR